MNLDLKISCDGFKPNESSSSSKIDLDYPRPRVVPTCNETSTKSSYNTEEECKCPSALFSTSSSISSALIDQDCRYPKEACFEVPNLNKEMCLAKSYLQQYSTISGNNLYDHLSDIIKRVVDERPPNVIDFFEEFSRNVREQKLHLPERFPPNACFEETRLYNVAKRQLISMQLPYHQEYDAQVAEEDLEEEQQNTEDIKLDIKPEPLLPIFRTFYDRVQHLQFFWNQCGLSISSEDIFQLAAAMNRLQTHPSVKQCRFWGMLNGLKASYYVVEAQLSNEEIESRIVMMQKEMMDMCEKSEKVDSHIVPELTPGAVGWDDYPFDEVLKMKPEAEPIPLMKREPVFDCPPEPIGKGVNRYSYFVINALSDEWFELPICTPKQIKISRLIKKFLTGDLQAEISSYPSFPGQEKHYLRAMIARITAGTYIAPRGYYRKMTKHEKLLFEGIDFEDMEEDVEEEEEAMDEGEEEELDEIDNDIVLVKSEKYEPLAASILCHPSKWQHVRPSILNQGRVVWFDEEKAKLERDKECKRLERLRILEAMGMEEAEEEEEETNEEGDEGEEEEMGEDLRREVGPSILSNCARDVNEEILIPWVGRFSTKYTNRSERILIMKSNVWPGAYTFTFENLCESIYLGWGHKYVSRNMAWTHMPTIAEEYSEGIGEFVEEMDPSVEMEEAYRMSLLKKELKISDMGENLSEYDDETQDSGNRSEDDEEEDEEEEEEEEEEE